MDGSLKNQLFKRKFKETPHNGMPNLPIPIHPSQRLHLGIYIKEPVLDVMHGDNRINGENEFHPFFRISA